MKKMNLFAIVAIIATVSLGVYSCGKKEIKPSQLENTYWVLETLDGNNAKDLFEGPVPSLEFNFKDSLISGNSGCNRFFGKFDLNKNKFSAPNIAGTRMACFFQNAESEFLTALSGNNMQLDIMKDTVLSFKKDNVEVLRFIKGAKED